MGNITRRDVLRTVPAAALAGAAKGALAVTARHRVFVGSNTPEGILAWDWDSATGELQSAGVAAKLDNVDWILYSHDRSHLFAASEVDSFRGIPTGAVASYSVEGGRLTAVSAQNSAAKGTCHIGLDKTGRVLISADYGGGAAAAFQITVGLLSKATWTEHYKGTGPVTDRQEAAHAHFASFSPDNRFAYINDLGSDCIHIYRLHAETAMLESVGAYKAPPGSGPRTLHFHPNGITAYCMNELNSSVDVLQWHKADGTLAPVSHLNLKPDPAKGPNTGCDTVITRDGRFAYFANRGDDFIFACSVDAKTGALTPIGKTPSGGKTPRNFVLDPTEKWMLVANQNSSQLVVFRRNVETGEIAAQGRAFDCPSPMCILF
jgi:6-phosphogluconolactonase